MCNRSRDLPGNRKQECLPTHSITEGECTDLSVDTMHINNPSVLFEFNCSAVSRFPLPYRIIVLCHYSLTLTKNHFLAKLNGAKRPLWADVPVYTHPLHDLLINT